MNALAVFAILAFAICMVLTPVTRDIFLRFGITDRPDEIRKFHTVPTPRIGGIPIALSYAIALVVMLLFAPAWAKLSVQHSRLILGLLPAAGTIFITGLLDDIVTLRPKQKLIGQILAAALAVVFGGPVSSLSAHPGSLWITIPLSMIWLIGCTNAFNLIDGLDGLATGIGLLATITTLIVALVQGNFGLAMATAPLAGCLLAFLRYNFNPASVFLGDSGSLTIGFMLGCFSLIWSERSGSLLGMVAPLMVLALPLIDVGLAISRRLLRSQPIFEGDRGHIHHMVLALGYKPRDAALILYGVCALAASLAMLQSFIMYQLRGLIILVFFALVAVGVNYLGYIEFSAARRTLSRRVLLRLMKEEIYMQELTIALSQVESVEECWIIIRNACRDLSFASVQMTLQEQRYEANFLLLMQESPWTLTVALGSQGQLVLTRTHETGSPRNMMAVLDQLQQVVAARQHIFANPPRKAS